MSEVDFGGCALVAPPCTPNSGRYTFFTSFRILRHHVAWHGPSPTQNDANRRLRRFASFSKRYQQLKGNPELQATELPSMHFGTASRNAGGVSRHPAHEYIVFAKIPTTYIGATCPKPPTCRTPNLCPSSTFINWAKNVQQH